MDECEQEVKTPMKRNGSARKVLAFNNIRQQLNEQLRCLDVRVESQVSLLQELVEFFRKRGELESDYSRNLEKFARSVLLRDKEQKQKRQQWPTFSSFGCWQQLVTQTQALSKDHNTLSLLYTQKMIVSLQTAIEDIQRIYKNCRAIAYEIHEEILTLLQELNASMRNYQRLDGECKAAKAKLVLAEEQQQKLQQIIPEDKLERSKKYKITEKELLKRTTKYTEARLKALKAKNEYQLSLDASNATIYKYFVEDLSDLIDCMDLGFGSVVSRVLLMHISADQGRSRALLQQADGLTSLVYSIDSRADKQKFLEQFHAAFMIPKSLEFQGETNDSIEPEIQKALFLDMELRLQLLEERLHNLHTESEEIWKTLETAELKLHEHLGAKDGDISEHFADHSTVSIEHTVAASPEATKIKADKEDLEDYYVSKIREYMGETSRIARLHAKAETLRKTLATADPSTGGEFRDHLRICRRKRIGRINRSGQPKLFGGSLEEYLEATGEQIPLIMRSCVRVITLYGLQHQGIFRIPGSQLEITRFRYVFEEGGDPLANTTDASDINSVAGVLKLYLRELREPLFPTIFFDYFVSIAELQTRDAIVLGLKRFLQCLPPSVVIVVRYLFAFLHHLSQYAQDNMMDAYNLAICFGPTLLPVPEDRDQVQFQNQVNELMKYMIVYHEQLFPKDLQGVEYEKYASTEPLTDIEADEMYKSFAYDDVEPPPEFIAAAPTAADVVAAAATAAVTAETPSPKDKVEPRPFSDGLPGRH